jgi:predicted NUDIX family phosphoesterase
MTDERVLCVPSAFWNFIADAGYSHSDRLGALLAQATYRNRKTPNDDGPPAEEDERWVQLIPYVLVFDERGQILSYNRGDKGGENRLGGKWSCGFGGHVNDKDEGWLGGIVRELREELCFTAAIVPPETLFGVGDWAVLSGPLGFLRDDSTPVGRVHLGVLYEIKAGSVTPKEDVAWTWSSVGLLRRMAEKNPDDLEKWSRMALDVLKGGA